MHVLLFAMLESEHHAAVATQVRHEPSDPEQGQSVIESDHHELDVDESLAVHSPTVDCLTRVCIQLCVVCAISSSLPMLMMSVRNTSPSSSALSLCNKFQQTT